MQGSPSGWSWWTVWRHLQLVAASPERCLRFLCGRSAHTGVQKHWQKTHSFTTILALFAEIKNVIHSSLSNTTQYLISEYSCSFPCSQASLVKMISRNHLKELAIPRHILFKKSGLLCQPMRAQELCESRGGHPGLPIPNNPYGLCGRKATMHDASLLGRTERRAQNKNFKSRSLVENAPLVCLFSIPFSLIFHLESNFNK